MIRIFADTTSGIPPDEAKKLGITYMPQIIVFGEESYRDDYEMDIAGFMKRLKSSPVMPKTAAPPPELYKPYYEEFSKNGDTMIVLCPSSDVSGTVRSALVAAKDFPDADIRVIDTRTVAAGLGVLVLEALEWVKEGFSADEIVAKVTELGLRERLYFYVDTLEYLRRGGRIGGAAALVGGILQVKPILIFRNGRVEPFEKLRTKKTAMAKLKELVLQECPHDGSSFLHVQHIEAKEEAEFLANELKQNFNLTEVPIIELPPAIITHAGPGAIVVSFFVKPG